ncbi:MAG TPA: alpha/beta fold hydrolase [Candidatus Dormibacteraeota bacterium]|nr:alpha/beta fold hydrolase [Candidatus Dormibacteraeota bacterium]
MAQLQERSVNYQGGVVRYLVGGDGPHLVLCHGFLGSAENFETWFDELARVRTLVIPDLPGCGASAPLLGVRHTTGRLAAAVDAVCRDARVERFDVGGLCLGASVAMRLLTRRPADVGRLVLHTPLLAPRLVRRRFHLQVRGFTAPGIFPVISWLSRRRVVSDLYKRVLVEGDNVDRAAAEMNFRNQLRADPRALREWILDGLGGDDVEQLRESRKQALIIVASDDRIVDVAQLRSTVTGMGHVHVAEVADAGHGWTESYVRRQLELIAAFLQDRPLPARAAVAAVA